MRLRKIKGAMEFLESHPDYVILEPEKLKGKWNTVFKKKQPIHIEIGSGKGQFIYDMALKYPEVNFIAIEKFDSVLIRALEKFIDSGIDNVKLMLFDALTIDEVFDKEVDRIYLNFSDPWPKARHAKRRLTSPRFLTNYEKILSGKIIFKTDNRDFFDYSLETLEEYGMILEDVTFDLHSLDVENVMTEFEKKFSSQGYKINRVVARFRGEDDGK